MKKDKNSWDLTLLYKSEKDPQIEKDIKKIEKSCEVFAKNYKKANFTSTPEKLAKALKDYEKITDILNNSKPWWYFALSSDLNSEDTTSRAFETKLQERLTKATNEIKFFILDIGKIPKSKHSIFLKHKSLLKYEYFLKTIFDESKYNLSEKEEQLKSLLSQTSYAMWVDSGQKILNQQTIEHKGKKLPIANAVNILSDLPKKERRELQKKINQALKSISSFAEAEYNAIYSYKKVMDELRGYKNPYSATVLSYENDEKTVESLVRTVTKNFHISRRFYKLHAKIMGEKKLLISDRAVKAGVIKKKFDFETSVDIVKKTFDKIDQKYANILEDFIKNKQIDVYSKKGKKSGAYCWGMGHLPTFVLLNHSDDVRSVETLAHEMGHAIHTELSKSQPPFYHHYSTATAEVASTFFEQAVIVDMEQYLSKEEKIIFLHNKIQGDISTIFRQVAFFNFEVELHKQIREKGQISKEEISAIMVKNLKDYMGDVFDITPDDGYFFVYLSHARRFFYVYSYAYGQLISRALFDNWEKDHTYSKKVKKFLTAGRSMSPKDIFKSIGIDTSNPKFFEAGLKSIENDIKKLEKLAKKTKFK